MLDQRIKFILGIIFAVLFLGLMGGQMAIRDPRFLAVAAALCAGGVVVFRGINVEGLSAFQALFYILFLIVLVITWTPFKMLGYLTPVILMGGLILGLATSNDARPLLRLIAVVLVWSLITIVHKAFTPNFITQNSIISWFTYATFFAVYIIPSKMLASRPLFFKIAGAMTAMVLLQAVVGILQFAYGAAFSGMPTHILGDWVEGTINPALRTGGGYESAMFTTNIASAALFLAAAYFRGYRKCRWPLLLALIAFLMADRVHLSVTLIAAVFLAYIWLRPPLARGSASARFSMAAAVGVVLLIGAIVSWDRIGHTPVKMEQVRAGRNPKAQLYEITLKTLPQYYTYYPLWGLGPGQFASRASIIAAGYLGALPAPFKFKTSDPLNLHGIPLWQDYFYNRYRGSLDRPAASWASFISEFGFVAAFLLVLLMIRILLRARSAIQTKLDRVDVFFLAGNLIFIFSLGITDYYWETCQAVFIGSLLVKLLYANIIYRTLDESADEGQPIPAPLPATRFTPSGYPSAAALSPRTRLPGAQAPTRRTPHTPTRRDGPPFLR